MTEDAELQPAVAAEFLALADLLAETSQAEWDSPSLCEGWRVREVIAHLTMATRYSTEEFMAELEHWGFDFTALSNKVAARDGQLPTAQLVANLRADSMHHWTPPGGGYRGALNHVVIHGLDVTVPLGMGRRGSDSAARVVLDDLTTGAGHRHFGIDIQGRRLRATDQDWSYGSGTELRGATEDLLLALCGRTITDGRLEGPPLQQLSEG